MEDTLNEKVALKSMYTPSYNNIFLSTGLRRPKQAGCITDSSKGMLSMVAGEEQQAQPWILWIGNHTQEA